MTSISRTSLTMTGLVAVLALGCQAADDADDLDVLTQDVACTPSIDAGIAPIETSEGKADAGLDAGGDVDARTPRPDAGPVVVRPPNVPYYAEVRANGTGCAPGTWSAAVSADGASFEVTFSEYEAEVDEGTRIAIKDCNLTVRLRSPSGISFSITDFSYEGYAFLEADVRAFATANYYFQGNPVPQTAKRTELSGPLDRAYLFTDNVRTTDAIWSPCGLDRNLQIVTRIGLQKSQNKGEGYINLPKIRSPKLAWRKCN